METQTMMPRRTVWVVLLVMVTAWGAAFSGIKVLLRDLSPAALTSGRLAVAAVSFAVFLPFAPKRPIEKRPGDLPRLVLIGSIGSAGYHLSLNWGEQYVSAGLASLLVATMPVMVAVLAAVFLREQLGPRRAVGAAVAFGGVAVLVVGSGRGIAAASVAGILVTLLAPLSWSVYTLIAKPLAERYDGVRINVIGAWAGALIVLPLGLRDAALFGRLDVSGWLWLVYLGAISQAAAYVVYAWALRRLEASAAASAVYFVPVSSLVWAWLLLGEVPGILALVGGTLIVGGVVLVVRRPGRVAAPADA